jgi:hypothetical protein
MTGSSAVDSTLAMRHSVRSIGVGKSKFPSGNVDGTEDGAADGDAEVKVLDRSTEL